MMQVVYDDLIIYKILKMIDKFSIVLLTLYTMVPPVCNHCREQPHFVLWSLCLGIGSAFQFTENVTDLLFRGWTTSTDLEMAWTCIFFAVIPIILELLKLLELYLGQRAHVDPLTYAKTEANVNARSPLLRPLIIPPTVQAIRVRKIKYHVVQTGVRVMTLVIGYILMLAVMSYNAWIFLAVCAGAGIGYFTIGAYRALLASRATRPAAPVCHVESEMPGPTHDSSGRTHRRLVYS